MRRMTGDGVRNVLGGWLSDAPSMRRVATGALVACASGLVLCRFWEPQLPWLAWPRAFFEAGTIGALADWFAVVALFRHPLGLPIPHTAILPNNKARVAEAVAQFIERSFLTEEQLGPRLRSFDYAGAAARWLEQHSALLAQKAAGYLPGILGGLSSAEMSALLAARARDMLRGTDWASAAASALEVILADGRDRELFEQTLRSARELVHEHRSTIESKIREEIPISSEWLSNLGPLRDMAGPLLDRLRDAIAAAVAAKTIENVESVLEAAAREPDSALWQSFETKTRRLISDLKTSPKLAEKIQQVREAVASSAVVEDFAARAWSELRAFVLRDCASADSLVRGKLQEAAQAAARRLQESDPARRELNSVVGEELLRAALATRRHVRELVISTIQGWDARQMTERLEAAVARDLQFIRINGTLVGGLIGLGLHAAFALVGR